jgi:hypothetical protein
MEEAVAKIRDLQRTDPRPPLSSAEIRALLYVDPMQDYEE